MVFAQDLKVLVYHLSPLLVGRQQPACLTAKPPLGLRTRRTGASGMALCDVVLGVSGVPQKQHRLKCCSLNMVLDCVFPCNGLNSCTCLFVFSQVPSSLLRSKITKPNVYHESKLVAKEYQAAKACLFRAFIKAGLGAWVEKPTEQDQFSLTP